MVVVVVLGWGRITPAAGWPSAAAIAAASEQQEEGGIAQ